MFLGANCYTKYEQAYGETIMTTRKSETNRIIEYMITGGAFFWSGYIVFAVLYSVFHVDLVVAKIVSFLVGLSVNFVLERFWVFGGRQARKELDTVSARYIILSVVNLGIDTVIVWSLNQVGISPYIGQFISAGFFTVWNYLWYKLWVFAAKTSPKPRRSAAPALHRPKTVRRSRVKTSKK